MTNPTKEQLELLEIYDNWGDGGKYTSIEAFCEEIYQDQRFNFNNEWEILNALMAAQEAKTRMDERGRAARIVGADLCFKYCECCETGKKIKQQILTDNPDKNE